MLDELSKLWETYVLWGLRNKRYFYIKYIEVLETLWFTAAFASAQTNIAWMHSVVTIQRTDLEEISVWKCLRCAMPILKRRFKCNKDIPFPLRILLWGTCNLIEQNMQSYWSLSMNVCNADTATYKTLL